MVDGLDGVSLGVEQGYPTAYDAGLLQGIPRKLSRSSLGFAEFQGQDIWTAYELSWLDGSGKPVVAIAEFIVPASSPNIVESKSFKYYLNSFNQERFSDQSEVVRRLEGDLSRVAGLPVAVRIYSLDAFASHRSASVSIGECLDGLDVGRLDAEPSPEVLQLDLGVSELSGMTSKTYCSHLLKSNCPVTGQPDWASIWVGVDSKRPLKAESLLRYLISYRMHQDFHESCVERIFCDIQKVCDPVDLWVYARYTRRGGLDINPFRSLRPMAGAPRLFGVRQ